MSCLPAVPLSDLVTKDYMSAEFSKFALTLAEQREADRAEYAAQRESDRETYRKHSSRQFLWLIGTFVALTGVLIGAIYGVIAIA